MTEEIARESRGGQVRKALEEHLPPVTLLLGNPYEMESLARDILSGHGISASDISYSRKLSVEAARLLVGAVAHNPFGALKAVVLRLDGMSEQSQNVLLKTLEEPPAHVRFILISDRPPIATILSRSQVYGFGVVVVADAPEGSTRAKVSQAVRAAMSGDVQLLCMAFRDWDERCSAELRDWALAQARPARARVNAPGPDVEPHQAMTVLTTLSRHARARPVNAAMAALALAFVEAND